MDNIPYYMAYAAGVLSFLSPCCLGLFPSYLSFITGSSFNTLISHENKRQVIGVTMTNSVAFILGFSVLFMLLGAMASMIGQLFLEYRQWLRITGGIVIIIFALFTVGILHNRLLSKDVRYHFHKKPAGFLGSFLVGLGFAAGWIPCSGPILSSILLYATAEASAAYGTKLLAVYSMGLGTPFLVFGLFFNYFLSHMKFLSRYQKTFVYLNAVIMILFGILLVTGKSAIFVYWMPNLGIEF
jgi:cytochrome c-type biogenesis protein